MIPRQALKQAIEAALEKVDPAVLTTAAIDRLGITGEVCVVAIGKAAAGMARGAAARLTIIDGLVVSDHEEAVPAQTRLMIGGHPVPTRASEAAGLAVLEMVAASQHPVLFLISGGGSALCELASSPLTLDDLAGTTEALLLSGASIDEINSVRPHLSMIKGGRLGAAAREISATLILSDVTGGGGAENVASGPSLPGHSTLADALAVIRNHHLEDRVPKAVLDHLSSASPPQAPMAHPMAVVGDVDTAVSAAMAAVEDLGRPAHRGRTLVGDARGAMTTILGEAASGVTVAGGETTVNVQGDGKGGRNQHAALAAALAIEARDDQIVVAFATDGIDGNTDAAGAIVDGGTVARARAAGLDSAAHLARFDSHPLLAATGDLLKTGPTGTNVADIWLVWKD
jgi:hydroxypyruvate reductase